MGYEGLTFDSFMSKLKGGEYVAIAGARRAVGRMKWPKAQLATAKEAIDKHFKVSGNEAKAPKGKPGPKPKAKTVEAAAPAKPRGKPGPKPGAARLGRPPKALQQPKAVAGDTALYMQKQSAFTPSNRLELVDARDLNNSIASLIDAYANVKKVDPSVNMAELQLIIDTAAINVKRHIRPYIVGNEPESTEQSGKTPKYAKSSETVKETSLVSEPAPKRRIVEAAPVKAQAPIGTVESPKQVLAPVVEETEEEDESLALESEDEDTGPTASVDDDDEEELNPEKLRLTNSWRTAVASASKS